MLDIEEVFRHAGRLGHIGQVRVHKNPEKYKHLL